MKTQFYISLLLVLYQVDATAADVLQAGEYALISGGNSRVNIKISNDVLADVDMLIDSNGRCSGSVSHRGIIMGSGVILKPNKTCQIEIGAVGKNIRINEQSCGEFHGAGCEFAGTFKRIGEPIQNATMEYEKKSNKLAVAFLDEVAQLQAPRLTISTSYPDDKIIIGTEYIGVGNRSVDIGRHIDTFVDYKGVLRSMEYVSIKARPGKHGACVDVVIIGKNDRIPRNISLDTNLCPRGNSIDLNINN